MNPNHDDHGRFSEGGGSGGGGKAAHARVPKLGGSVASATAKITGSTPGGSKLVLRQGGRTLVGHQIGTSPGGSRVHVKLESGKSIWASR